MKNRETDKLSSVKQALIALDEMQHKLDAAEARGQEPIAVVGMACRFPGGVRDPAGFWDLLQAGRDGISEVPPDRWDIDAFFDADPARPGKMNSRWGGFLEDIDAFDEGFFGISPLEAAQIDPQQRQMFEVGWEALEDAGETLAGLAGSRTAVFVGVCTTDFQHHLVGGGSSPPPGAYGMTGLAPSIVTNRFSYLLDLRGPSITLDTACSSSLVAIHLACRSLRTKECDRAVAGGVNAILEPFISISASRALVLAPDGRCKAFDASADGIVRSEGCGVIVLKRLRDALAQGDRVRAVILGSAVNQDGRTNGLTAPNTLAQKAVLREALADARVQPEELSYIEAHGTGTPLGDPIEFEALADVYGARSASLPRCGIGSLKTNLGHMEASAGVGGLIKLVLAIEHGEIPRNLHFRRPNPRLGIERTPFFIPVKTERWAPTSPRRGAVSGFGMGGTNAHLVLSQAPAPPAYPDAPGEDRAEIVVLSARSADSLRRQAGRWAGQIDDGGHGPVLRDLSYTAAVRRSHFGVRLAAIVRSRGELIEALREHAQGRSSSRLVLGGAVDRQTTLTYVFSGQGSQWPQMGMDLMRCEPIFRRTMETCAARIRARAGWSLLDELARPEESSRLQQTEIAQPAITACQLALAELLSHWGFRPGAVVGHSLGEIAAAQVAGVLDLEQAVDLAVCRGQLMQSATGLGRMAAVSASAEAIAAEVERASGRVSLAGINSPASVVLAGETEALAALLSSLGARGIRSQDLGVNYAFHSPQVEAAAAELTRQLRGLTPRAAAIPIYSAGKGGRYAGEEMTSEFWGRCIREPVLFGPAIGALLSAGSATLVEIGPHPILRRPVQETAAAQGTSAVLLPSLRKSGDGGRGQLLRLVGELYVSGMDPCWQEICPPGALVSLPTYAWDHTRYGVPHGEVASPPPPAVRSDHPLLTLHQEGAGAHVFEADLELHSPTFVAEHRIQGLTVFPAAAFFEMAIAAAQRVCKAGELWLEDVTLLSPLLVERRHRFRLTLATSGDPGPLSLSVSSSSGDDPAMNAHLRARIVTGAVPMDQTAPSLAELQQRCTQELPLESFHALLSALGFELGPRFLGLRRLWHERGALLGRIALAPEYQREAARYWFFPPFLDAALQLLALAWANEGGVLSPDRIALPIAVDRLALRRAPAFELWAYARLWPGSAAEAPTIKGDLWIFDDHGTAVASLAGAALLRAEAGALRGRATNRVAELCYQPCWQEEPRVASPSEPSAGRWLLLSDGPAGAALADALGARGAQTTEVLLDDHLDPHPERPGVRRVSPTDRAALRGLLEGSATAGGPWTGVVHLWGLTHGLAALPEPESLEDGLGRGCGTLLPLLQELVAGERRLRLWVGTCGAWSTVAGERPALDGLQATLWGMGRTIALEHPHLWGGLFDLDPSAVGSSAGLAVDELLGADTAVEVAFRNQVRLVPRLRPAAVASPPPERRPITPGATYLITGGMGGVGLQLARWLVQGGAGRVILASRRGPDAAAAAAIAELTAAGGTIEVVQADVAKQSDVEGLIAAAGSRLSGILHAAGVLEDRVLTGLTWESFRAVLSAKIDGTLQLLRTTRNGPLDWLVLCSSGASLFGAPGQANYAAANAFLDGVAQIARAQGRPVICINWGAWSGAGMLARTPAALRARLGRRAVGELTAWEAWAALDLALGSTAAQLFIGRVDWGRLLDGQPRAATPAMCVDLVKAAGAAAPAAAVARYTAATTPDGERWVAELARSPEKVRQMALQEWLITELRQALNLRQDDPVDPEKPIMEMGFDSLLAIEFRNSLSADLGHPLPATLIFDHPTLGKLAGFLAGWIAEWADAGSAATVPAAGPERPSPASTDGGVLPRPRAGVTATKDDAIAIIGMACRFPAGANSLKEYWELLEEGRDGISEVPPDRWDVEALYHPMAGTPGKSYGRWGGFLQGVDIRAFDSAFFGLSHREASWMDPQQRLLLEVTWEALENAGLVLDKLRDSATGVFLGMCSNDYGLLTGAWTDMDRMDPMAASGNSFSGSAGRISYAFGLRGPNFPVDTACSSALVAVHQGCQSLRNGECELAFAGAVNQLLSPHVFVLFSQVGVLAPDGRCKTFDAGANGFVRAEGCGVVVLKRLDRALQDGDRVAAVIRGSAINHDGRSSSFTAPSSEAERAVIAQALESARLDAMAIDFIETHGTGTPLGDPLELNGLRAVTSARPLTHPVVLGAVKSNVGHLEAAAGMAGLIKLVLCLQHEKIPANLHFKSPSVHLPWDTLPLLVPTRAIPWPAIDRPRRAGLSSFGLSGTNVHLILEEAPPVRSAARAAAAGGSARAGQGSLDAEQDSWRLLLLSARSSRALVELALATANQLAEGPAQDLDALCYTAALRRTHHPRRLSAVGRSAEELAGSLRSLAETLAEDRRVAERPPKVAFVFSGQGSLWANMASQLSRAEPVLRRGLEACDRALRPFVSWSALELIDGGAGDGVLEKIEVAQPLVCAVQIALADLWRHYGVEPAAVIGHSMGEVAAAHVAGMLSLEDSFRVICTRSALFATGIGHGFMLVVEAAAEEIEDLLERHRGEVVIAAYNGPRNLVLSGEQRVLPELMQALSARKLQSAPLKVAGGGHSPQVDIIREPMLRALEALSPRAGGIPFYSTATGQIEDGARLGPEYWFANARWPVQFARALSASYADGVRTFLEVSPHPVLTKPMEATLRTLGKDSSVIASLRRGAAREALLRSLGNLFAAGHEMRWGLLHPRPLPLADLPAYPWQRRRHWREAPSGRAAMTQPRSKGARSFVSGYHRSPEDPHRHVWELTLDASFLADHRVDGVAIIPAVVWVEAVLEAAAALFGPGPAQLGEVDLEGICLIPESGVVEAELVILEEGSGPWTFTIASRGEQTGVGGRTLVRGLLRHGQVPPPSSVTPLQLIQERCPAQLEGATFYGVADSTGWGFGPAFQTLRRLWLGQRESLAEVVVPDQVPEAPYRLHPLLLDGGFQSVAGAAGIREVGQLGGIVLPVRIGELVVHGAPGRAAWAHARVAAGAPQLDAFEGEVRLLDEAGCPLVEARGLAVRMIETVSSASARIEDHLYEPRWEPQPPDLSEQAGTLRPPGDQARCWLLVDAPADIGAALTHMLAASDTERVLVAKDPGGSPADGHQGRSAPVGTSGVGQLLAQLPVWPSDVLLFSSGHGAVAGTLGPDAGSWRVLEWARALLERTSRRSPRLWLITRALHSPGPAAEESAGPLPSFDQLAQAVVEGLLPTLRLEHPELRPSSVDLSASSSAAELAELARVLREDGPEDRLALRQGQRWLARIGRAELASAPAVSPGLTLRAEASYLITGGLGGLGMTVAAWMLKRGAKHVVLAGRQPPGKAAAAELARLGQDGAQVSYAPLDVGSAEMVATLLEQLDAAGTPLAGVVHAAGVLDNAVVRDLDQGRVRAVMAPKVYGAWNLHCATAERSLDFFVLFSSWAALMGGVGQANYAAANAFLDVLAHGRRRAGLPALSLNWGAWSGVGGAARAIAEGRFVMPPGTTCLSPADGTRALELAMRSGRAQLAVQPVDWQRLARACREGVLPPLPPFFAAVMESTALDRDALRPGALRGQLLDLPPAARRELLERYLAREVGQALGMEAEGIATDLPLSLLGFDSRMAIQVKNRINLDIGEVVSIVKLAANPTVADICQSILQRIDDEAAPAASPRSDSEPVDLDVEARLALPGGTLPDTLPAVAPAPGTVLLTGATGFLGAFLLQNLLRRQPELRVKCLVRAESAAAARSRIEANLRSYRLQAPGLDDRLEAIAGDLARPRLGLSRERYAALASEVDLVVHNAARVDIALPYSALKADNVGGTLEVLAFCARDQLKPMHHVSTLAVFTAEEYARAERIREDDPLRCHRGIRNGYMQTKWVAEQALMQARARGAPVSIYRVGLVAGDTLAGASDRDGWLSLLVGGLVGAGVAPALDLPLNLAPVDFVAEAIVHLAFRQESRDRCFHLFNPISTPMRTLFAWLQEGGYPLREVSPAAFDAVVAGAGAGQSAAVVAQLIRSLIGDERPLGYEAYEMATRVDWSNTHEGLTGTGIRCPAINRDLFKSYLSYFRDTGIIARPPG